MINGQAKRLNIKMEVRTKNQNEELMSQNY